MALTLRPIKLRGPVKRIDRRLLRSGLYALALVILFLAFNATEWLIENYLAIGDNHSLIAALLVALSLAIVFQIFHKRIEHTVEGWLHRRLHERQKGLTSLAQEITLIRDRKVLEKMMRRFTISKKAWRCIGPIQRRCGLVYIAILHVARNQFAIAARLVGALDARGKAIGSINAHLASRASIAEYQSAVEKLRANMPTTAFEAEWQAGHNLTFEQSIELALS